MWRWRSRAPLRSPQACRFGESRRNVCGTRPQGQRVLSCGASPPGTSTCCAVLYPLCCRQRGRAAAWRPARSCGAPGSPPAPPGCRRPAARAASRPVRALTTGGGSCARLQPWVASVGGGHACSPAPIAQRGSSRGGAWPGRTRPQLFAPTPYQTGCRRAPFSRLLLGRRRPRWAEAHQLLGGAHGAEQVEGRAGAGEDAAEEGETRARGADAGGDAASNTAQRGGVAARAAPC